MTLDFTSTPSLARDLLHLHPGTYQPHISHLRNNSISPLASFSGLILTIILLLLALSRLYLFEPYIPLIYRKTWSRLTDPTSQRNFINHHVSAILKFTMLATQIYPLMDVCFGKGTLHSPMSPGSRVTNGGMMIVGAEIFVAMYFFELFYRVRVSYISTAHHVGAIVIAQTAVAIGLDYVRERDATVEFLLCFVWGMFDVIAEFFPHIALILYRTHSSSHYFLFWVFRLCSFLEIAGTTIETVMILWFFADLWKTWTLPFKIVTPMLHVLFSVAQLWGAVVFWRIAKKEGRLAREELEEGTGEAAWGAKAVGVEEEEKKEVVDEGVSMAPGQELRPQSTSLERDVEIAPL